MSYRDIVESYLTGFASRRGDDVAALFAIDGVLDDGAGNHFCGRDEVAAYFSGLPFDCDLDAPLNYIDNADRQTAYGRVRPRVEGTYEGSDEGWLSQRWVVHFRGNEIAHVSSSTVTFLYGV